MSAEALSAYLNTNTDLERLTISELDALPFGVIEVNKEGIVLTYNKAQSRFSRKPRMSVIGKNFFTDIAPCTNNSLFRGKFYDKVVNSGERVRLSYVFSHGLIYSKVVVEMREAWGGMSFWIIVKKL